MSLSSHINLYNTYINELRHALVEMSRYENNIGDLLFHMTAHDYSQNEFLGKNLEIYESDIQDHRAEIRRILAGRYAYNISNIQRRIRYLEGRITDMDDELRRQKE